MVATDDFRDGAATGARILADRLIQAQAWGVPLHILVIRAMAAAVAEEFGGNPNADRT